MVSGTFEATIKTVGCLKNTIGRFTLHLKKIYLKAEEYATEEIEGEHFIPLFGVVGSDPPALENASMRDETKQQRIRQVLAHTSEERPKLPDISTITTREIYYKRIF